MYPLSIQLYSLREECEKDFRGVLEWVAQTGFKGVEPAGFYGMTPTEFKRIISDLGLEISSSHTPWCSPENLNEVIDTAGILGVQTAGCGYGPEAFKDLDAIKRTADKVNAMSPVLKKSGITLFQHNHHWEFEKIDGRLAYELYAELCPEVMFELDAYWSAAFGANDPAEMMKKFRDRVILIHMKDGTLDLEIDMLPLGRGKMDIPAILNAADPARVQWVITELDNCVIDMRTALAKSYDYMTKNRLALGNR